MSDSIAFSRPRSHYSRGLDQLGPPRSLARREANIARGQYQFHYQRKVAAKRHKYFADHPDKAAQVRAKLEERIGCTPEFARPEAERKQLTKLRIELGVDNSTRRARPVSLAPVALREPNWDV